MWMCEGWGGWWVLVDSALHDDRAVTDRGVLQDANGRHAVRATTVGESGILQSKAHIKGDTGVEAEGLV
jgi:hypothetical protein